MECAFTIAPSIPRLADADLLAHESGHRQRLDGLGPVLTQPQHHGLRGLPDPVRPGWQDTVWAGLAGSGWGQAEGSLAEWGGGGGQQHPGEVAGHGGGLGHWALGSRHLALSQEVTGCHRGSQVITGGHRGSQGVTGGQRDHRGSQGSQVVTGCHRWSQVVTGGHRGSQGIT